MNLTHMHLVLNHIPIIGIPVAVIFLFYGYWFRNIILQRFSLQVLFVLCLIILPVYFTGEPAEHRVEKLPEVSESLIENHEEAAESVLILTLLTVGASLAALYFRKNESRNRQLVLASIVFAVMTVGTLGYTANLGGKIRHTEIR